MAEQNSQPESRTIEIPCTKCSGVAVRFTIPPIPDDTLAAVRSMLKMAMAMKRIPFPKGMTNPLDLIPPGELASMTDATCGNCLSQSLREQIRVVS